MNCSAQRATGIQVVFYPFAYLSFLNFCPQKFGMIVLMAIVASRMQVPKVGLTCIVLLIVCSRITSILMTSESAYFKPLSLFPRFNCQISNAYRIVSLGYFIDILNSFCPKHKSSLIFT